MDKFEKHIFDIRADLDIELSQDNIYSRIFERLDDPLINCISQEKKGLQVPFENEKDIWISVEKKMINSDSINDFILSEKDELDTEFPSENLWAKISNELPLPETITKEETKTISIFQYKNFQYFAVACTLVLMMTIGWMIGKRSASQPEVNEIATIDNQIIEAVPEFKNKETNYLHTISDIEHKIQKIATEEDNEIITDFTKEVTDLTATYNQLKIEFINTKNEKVYQALLENLRTRISLLNEQLTILQQIIELKNNVEKPNGNPYQQVL